MPHTATIYFDNHRFLCKGEWHIANLPALEHSFAKLTIPHQNEIIIDGTEITALDTAGAWLLCQWMQQLSAKKHAVKLINFPSHSEKLIALTQKLKKESANVPATPGLSKTAALGKSIVKQFKEFYNYLGFIGGLSIEFIRIIRQPTHWRWKTLLASIYRTGYQALPIIGLLSLMIGIVLTYQMGLQLRNYGANIFIVDLLGLSVLREFAPLLTAIMVAGRTGSSFTAELGLMKTNQEIDALNTMGITSGELLILPKIIGLFISLPLLTMWAEIFGIMGGMIMSNHMLNISWYDFLQRFQHQIPLRALFIGLGKTPVFALIIASVSCFQGISVRNSADSIGKNTTKSVVYSIFFVIVADAIFSIIFSKFKL